MSLTCPHFLPRPQGRAEIRERAIRLAEAGLSAKSVARAVDQPCITVYTWLRRAGLARTREEWRESLADRGP